jgi:hypothetical protein
MKDQTPNIHTVQYTDDDRVSIIKSRLLLGWLEHNHPDIIEEAEALAKEIVLEPEEDES